MESYQRRRVIITILVISFLLIAAGQLLAQQDRSITIPLKWNFDYQPFVFFTIPFGENGSPSSVVAKIGQHKVGRARGDVLIRAERLRGQDKPYKVRVDTNGDGELEDEQAYLILPDSSIKFKVLRKWRNGGQMRLPYTISYSRATTEKGELKETLNWRSHYRREGRLKVDSCAALITLVDLNGDGRFDDSDLFGSSISIDRNRDGRIWGREEWVRASEIIEFCDRAFVVKNMEQDGSSLTLVETNLRIPKIGDRVPSFSANTIDGKTIHSEQFKGRVTILDFWASWCKPCVEKFPEVKDILSQLGNRIHIIFINVDVKSRVGRARKIIDEYGLPGPHVITGKGEADPIWKMFGSMENNSLTIPLYVLIDEQGILKYAGHGGNNLFELRQNIEQCLDNDSEIGQK